MRLALVALGASLLATPLSAQTPDSAAIKMKARVDAIFGIPRRTDEMRRAGVPDSSVRGILDVLVKEKVSPEEADNILIAHRDGLREHGPTDNFGAFVHAQLAAGKRGRELSDAIRAEHQARGKGKPSEAHGRPEGREHDDNAMSKGKDEEKEKKNKGKRPPDAAAKGRRPN